MLKNVLKFPSIFSVLLFVSQNINAQHMGLKVVDSTITLNDSVSFSVGDTILVNVPISYDFAFIEPQKKGFSVGKLSKIGNIGSAVGGVAGAVGGMSGSIGAIKAGGDIANAGAVVTSVGSTAEVLEKIDISGKAKKLSGSELLIEDFPKSDDSEGMIYAIARLNGGKKRYKVSIIQAYLTKEILAASKE